MTRKRVSMRKIREVLRLKYDLGLSDRLVGRAVKLARSTIADYVRRATTAGLSWPLPPELDDLQLEALLFGERYQAPKPADDLPDWAAVDKELRRKGVTRLLLWEEYRRHHPTGLQYATFNEQYRKWKATQGLSMRQHHRAGEKLFVDYAGLTLPITASRTGEVSPGQVFVATLGASDYTYVEVTRTQGVTNWLGAQVRALLFFGGVPEIIVPDNLKAGVTQASPYAPELNRSYLEFAEHYGVAIIPARVRKPKDKALVEVHVQIVERRILAPLRDRVFFSISEANEAVWLLLKDVNTQPFQKRAGSRWSLFTEVDQPALRPLPSHPYEVASWKTATVGLDYHVEVQGHYYSVPYRHAKAKVDVRLTPGLVEIFCAGTRIAAHGRVADTVHTRHRHTTVADHMPPAHQQYGDWNSGRLLGQAQRVGEATTTVIETMLAGRRHPEQSFRSCLGVLRLGKAYGEARLEAACVRAVSLKAFSYRSIESILKHRLDEVALEQGEPAPLVADHANVRGPAYYDAQPSQPGSETAELLAFDPLLN